MFKYVSPQEAVNFIRSNHRVFIHGAAATPHVLIKAMTERYEELENVDIVHIHTDGEAPYSDAKFKGIFHATSLFVGHNQRKPIQDGLADFVPIFLSEIPNLFRSNILPLDVALLQVSPPDKHGYCTLGTSVDIAVTAAKTAKYIIAQVNPQMPRTHGDGFIHVSKIDAMVEVDEKIGEQPVAVLSDIEKRIGKYCADLIDDGSTLQMGIGAIPDAVLCELGNHRRLGIHTEMFSDGLVNLWKKGAITNEYKKVYPGKIVGSFIVGSRKLYDFVDDNPEIAMIDVAVVNDTALIRKNPKAVSINSAIEVDLTGQVCADSIGTLQFSGIGGQMDFMRGSSLSEGGKPIIALPSITSKGITRIVPTLKEGAGVVTTRGHVHYIITEHGVAYLYGKNLRERAKAMINIAHPDHREALTRAAYERFKSLD